MVETELKLKLDTFLAQKPLYYNEIDYGRMPRAFAAVKEQLKLPKVIHVIGTNGKGTTGRFLASALHQAGYHVGHYTSPHIVKFNERIWIDGKDIDDASLEVLHTRLLALLPQKFVERLSYFEYTTFLAILAFETCDYAVMEAGLGGEHDATSVLDAELTLVTPIGKDHEVFLGTSIESIATTKLKAVKHTAILAYQNDSRVYKIAEQLQEQHKRVFILLEEVLDAQKTQMIQQQLQLLQFPQYLQNNFLHAVAALELLKVPYDVNKLESTPLFGRMSRVAENVIVDVGHNTLAARAIKESLIPNKFTLVYNSYHDKEYKCILEILLPIIEKVEIINVDDDRIVKRRVLEQVLEGLSIPYSDFEGVSLEKKYLVFGSFSVVEAFLKGLNG